MMDANIRFACSNLTAEFLGFTSVFLPPLLVNKFIFGIDTPAGKVLTLNTIAYGSGRAYWIAAKALNCRNIQNCLAFNFNSEQRVYEVDCLLALARKIMRIGILHLCGILPAFLISLAKSNIQMSFITAAVCMGSTTLSCECFGALAILINKLHKKIMARCHQGDIEEGLVDASGQDGDSFYE